jgi:predicted nucleotidyltransferase
MSAEIVYRAPSASLAGLRADARQTLEGLLGDPKIDALCLFGSVARGSAKEGSDLDLLGVVSNRSAAQEIRAELKSQHALGSMQVRLMTLDSLKQNFDGMTVFAAHLAREGKVLKDRQGRLSGWLDSYPKEAPVRETAANLASQLSVYEHLDWCAGHYLFCLADLYAWGRSGAMLVLAREAVFEFDRSRVFKRLREQRPDLSEASNLVSELRPFWQRVRRDERVDLPFSVTGSHARTARARDACVAIVRAGL